jgi:signal transduction histidine kinase
MSHSRIEMQAMEAQIMQSKTVANLVQVIAEEVNGPLERIATALETLAEHPGAEPALDEMVQALQQIAGSLDEQSHHQWRRSFSPPRPAFGVPHE